ncbi:MAG: glycosyltransferase [Planctomycetota bacterium]|nr:glycosyltransferase [Planctomycetota bacterium]
MRLLVVSARHHPEQGGIGTSVQSFVDAARLAGWHLDLMTRRGGDPTPASTNFEISTLDEHSDFQERVPVLRRIERIRPYRYGLWSLGVAEFLLTCEPNYDAVLFMDIQAEGLVSICSRAVRHHFVGVPFLVMAHGPMALAETVSGYDSNRFGRSIYHEWERLALSHADGVIGASNVLLDSIGPLEYSCAIPPLIDPLQTSDFESHEPVIVLVGDVDSHKGPDVWARSLNRVFRQVRDVRAELIGHDTPNGPEGTSLAAHVYSLIDPQHRRRFIWRGHLSHAKTLEAIDRSALVVVPSRFDGFSYVAAEAILRTRPLIVSDQVGIVDWVSGLATVPAGNADALAQCQIQVLQQSATWKIRMQAIRQQLVEACSPHRCLDSFETFIHSCHGLKSRFNSDANVEMIDTMKSWLADIESLERQSRRQVQVETMRPRNFTPQVVPTR